MAKQKQTPEAQELQSGPVVDPAIDPTADPVVDPVIGVKARVLVTGTYGAADDVIELAADDVAAAEASGQVDTHPDAVAYAESLKAA